MTYDEWKTREPQDSRDYEDGPEEDFDTEQAVQLRHYRVWMHTPAGMLTHYDGYVDVYADSPEAAKIEAVRQLRRTSFPDRDYGSWIVDKVEITT